MVSKVKACDDSTVLTVKKQDSSNANTSNAVAVTAASEVDPTKNKRAKRKTWSKDAA